LITTCDALVVGAGPAGLATSAALARAGVEHVALERGGQIGQTWANLYDGLVLHTARALSALPGLKFPRATPLFPTRRDFLAYLHRYAETFRLPIETGAEVQSLHRGDDMWIARTTAGRRIQARAVVIATGIVSNPYIPEIAGRDRFAGRVLHSVEYRRPEGFKSQRVLVVGAGNSAGEISVELAHAGADVTLAVRTGARVVPREIAGIPIQYFAVVLASLPKKAQRTVMAMMAEASALVRGSAILPPPPVKNCPNVPVIGLHLADLLREGAIHLKGGLIEFTDGGVRFADDSEQPFDTVILATGYRAAVGMMRDLIRLDECGFARRRDRVVSVDQPDLYFVGHNYDIRGGLLNIGRDARLAAGKITAMLRDTSRTSTGTRRPRSER
jgi:cation diffusion facilitator CzcD-associated flavoprotein CzcO